MRLRIERVREACEQIGRDPASLTLSIPGTVASGVTPADAARRAAAIGRELPELRDGGFAGTAAEIVDQIGAFAELGATRFYFQVLDLHDLDQLDFLAREVVPQFRSE